jgi:hypothetical protein
MALPKAVLCLLGDEPADHPAEAELRSTGFATFAITWKELDAVQNGWIQLLPPLDDPTVVAWAVAGRPGDFTASVRSKIALLTLGLERKAPPATAFVLTGEGEMPDVPHAMSHIRIFRREGKFAAKLLVAKARPQPLAPLPFYVKPHLDPLTGIWLEVAPPGAETWDGFMIGVTLAEITAFGVGPRGAVPSRSVLRYPLRGIEGTVGETPFQACAAQNGLSPEVSCYLRLDGAPGLVLCLEYPNGETEAATAGRTPVQLELV